MTETLYDLIKSGKVTKVCNEAHGVSTNIALTNRGENYPIVVYFAKPKVQSFTIEGKLLWDDEAPSIHPYTDFTEREQPEQTESIVELFAQSENKKLFDQCEELRHALSIVKNETVKLYAIIAEKDKYMQLQHEMIEILKAR
jgi:hypothetical protein